MDDRDPRSFYAPMNEETRPLNAQNSVEPRSPDSRSYELRTYQARSSEQGSSEQGSYDPGPCQTRSVTPPPSEDRGRCLECGAFGCHSDFHRGVGRSFHVGCYVCGRIRCHSRFHPGERPRYRGQGPPQPQQNSENGPRGPRQGDRPPPSNQSSPPSQHASA